jgi:hypothetical protein
MRNSRVRHFRRASWFAAAFAAIVLGPVVNGQQPQGADAQNTQTQTQTSAPIPAYHSPYTPNSEDVDESSQTMQPDTTPLSGAQYVSLGNLQTNRSYWQPLFDISGVADSNPQYNASNSPSSSSWDAWGSFVGGVEIHQTSGASQLMASYLGGGIYSNAAGVENGTIQELGLTEKYSFRRAVLSIIDQTSYLPETAVGLGGIGGLPLSGSGFTGVSSGIGSTGLGSGFVNSQTILSGEGQNLSNSSIVQLNTFLSPRSSITLAGGYSLLHFFGNNLTDSGDVIFRGGYNYQISEHNTMAVFYDYGHLTFSNTNQSVDSHSIQASYARRVTGRLAFQIAAGPEFEILNNGTEIPGSTPTPLGTNTGSSTQLSWTLSSAITYQYQRTNLGLSYAHGVVAGSGVLLGAESDEVAGTVNHRMSRTFSSGLSVGYSRNASLSNAGAATPSQNYGYWFAEATLAHPISQALALTFSYELQYQNSNNTFCVEATSCGTSVVQHMISVGLSWRQRPLLF